MLNMHYQTAANFVADDCLVFAIRDYNLDSEV